METVTITSKPTAHLSLIAPPTNPPLPSLLHRSLHTTPCKAISASGNYITLSTGQKVLDATGGAAVACLGHGNTQVAAAIASQTAQFSYAHMVMFTCEPAEQLASLLTNSTHGVMSRAFFLSSGSEAVEAALKLARQYHLEKKPAEPQRIHFIARKQSYHGNTLGALAVSGHVARRALFEPMLMPHFSHVSACNTYRDLRPGESDTEYVSRLAAELEDEFQRVGPSTVAAFVAEPVVGATNGCMTAPSGYFRAVKEVCERHGALLILDEVMSGMGRTGTLHAWQSEHVGVAPDIQTIGKGLGGGYAPVAGLLVNKGVVDTLQNGSGAFSHAQTYQSHPISCTAALAVQKIVQEQGLVENCAKMGRLLERLLVKRLASHPHVGDIRGRGLFWGIEFVQEKTTKKPFDPRFQIANAIHEKGMTPEYSIALYPGSGTVDGVVGDHILLGPAYNINEAEVRLIVDLTTSVIVDFFKEFSTTPAGLAIS